MPSFSISVQITYLRLYLRKDFIKVIGEIFSSFSQPFMHFEFEIIHSQNYFLKSKIFNPFNKLFGFFTATLPAITLFTPSQRQFYLIIRLYSTPKLNVKICFLTIFSMILKFSILFDLAPSKSTI